MGANINLTPDLPKTTTVLFIQPLGSAPKNMIFVFRPFHHTRHTTIYGQYWRQNLRICVEYWDICDIHGTCLLSCCVTAIIFDTSSYNRLLLTLLCWNMFDLCKYVSNSC